MIIPFQLRNERGRCRKLKIPYTPYPIKHRASWRDYESCCLVDQLLKQYGSDHPERVGRVLLKS